MNAFTLVAAVSTVAMLGALLGVCLRRVAQPMVMGEILVGLVLGKSGLGALGVDVHPVLFPDEIRSDLSTLANIGGVAFLGYVGACLDKSALRRVGGTAIKIAASTFAVPAVGGGLLAIWLYDAHGRGTEMLPFVLLVGTAMGVTAFPVLVRILDARGLTRTQTGVIAITVAAAQELLVWPLVILSLATARSDDPLSALCIAAAVAIGIAIIGRHLMPRVPARGAARSMMLVSLLGVSAIATDRAGLHVVVGAFLFAVALGDSDRQRLRDALTAPLARWPARVLLPLFFALPPLNVDLWSLGAAASWEFAAILAVATIGKLVGAGGMALVTGQGAAISVQLAVLMNTRGLVELVVLNLGLAAGVLDDQLYSMMVAMALLTTFAAGPVLTRVNASGAQEVEALASTGSTS